MFMTLIEKTFGKEQTTRTWETVMKVARLHSATTAAAQPAASWSDLKIPYTPVGGLVQRPPLRCGQGQREARIVLCVVLAPRGASLDRPRDDLAGPPCTAIGRADASPHDASTSFGESVPSSDRERTAIDRQSTVTRRATNPCREWIDIDRDGWTSVALV